mmetsp:Transcript_84739/g.197049  ORF Transcript_84739/g.197049 Transcript_84739/m.197049 type:complete len:83 (+) Transcript_84739:955-1203(+)
MLWCRHNNQRGPDELAPLLAWQPVAGGENRCNGKMRKRHHIGRATASNQVPPKASTGYCEGNYGCMAPRTAARHATLARLVP